MQRNPIRAVGVALVSLLVMACEGKSLGNTSGETSSGETSASGTSSGDGSNTGSGSGSETGEPSNCVAFFDESPGPAVTVTTRNNSQQTIYIVHTWQSVLTILNPEDEQISWRYDGFTLSCQELMEGVRFCGGCACGGTVTKVEPGGHWTEEWPGFFFEYATLPAECGPDDACGPDCVITRTPAPGSWRFETAAASDIICGAMPCPDCEPDPSSGACTISAFDLAPTSPPEPRGVEIEYPGATVAEIVFD